MFGRPAEKGQWFFFPFGSKTVTRTGRSAVQNRWVVEAQIRNSKSITPKIRKQNQNLSDQIRKFGKVPPRTPRTS